MHHRVLQRQMKKFGVAPDQPPRDQEVWNQFLARVDRFYREADQGRYLLERSLAISSREMQAIYNDLREASESRIAAERDRLRTVISSLGAGLCTLDKDGLVLSINPEGERLLGCVQDDVVGQPFFAWTPSYGDGHIPTGPCSLEEIIASGKPCREEDGVFTRKDGTLLPVSYTLNPIVEEGELVGAALVFLDITRPKQAEVALRESEERHHTLLNHLPVGVYQTTPEGRIVDANPAMAELFGVADVEALQDINARDFFLREADREHYVRHLLQDGTITAEYAMQRKNGEVFWMRDYARAIHDEAENATFFEGILVDITEQKQADEALQESEARLRAFVKALPGLALILDEDGCYVEVFSTQQQLLYDEAEQLKGRFLHEVLPEDVADVFLSVIRKALELGTPQTVDYSLDVLGGPRWFEGQVAPMRGRVGNRRMVIWIANDVTERKRAAEALRESEQRFRDLFESSPDAIFVEDLDGNVLDVNPAACQLHRTEADQLIGKNVRSLVPPDVEKEAMADFAKLISGELNRLEGASWTADGHEVPVEIRASHIMQDQRPSVMLQVRDITERKAAEQRLRLLEASVSASLDGITISDAHIEDLPLVYVSPGFERMTGYMAHEALGRNCRFLQNDDNDQPALATIRKALSTGTQCRVVLRNYRKDGTLFWNELTIYPLHDTMGRLAHYVGIQRDITERKQVEEALRQSQERYTLAVSAGNVGVWDWNLDTNEIYVDPILKQILGYEDHEIKNELDAWGGLVHPDDQEKVMAAAAAHLEGSAPVYEVEHRMMHRNGSVRWFVACGTAMRDAEGKPIRIVGTDTDVTERKQAAQELARINVKLEQRNRELQDFAYVASHDLQEPLRKIRAFADLMAEEYGDNVDETGKYYLNRMVDAATRMAGLITDLLAYSRVTTKVQPFGKVNLNSVVTDVLSDLEMQIKETGGRITVSNLPTIDADATQMHQLLQNFIGNALKFHKPDVTPVVDVVGVVETQATSAGRPDQAMCRLEVRDNGIGFDKKYLDRIFTPFQRLHGRGAYSGTGMGLAICRRIVERHHGTITADSKPGEGARFIVTLPVQQTPPRPEHETKGDAKPLL